MNETEDSAQKRRPRFIRHRPVLWTVLGTFGTNVVVSALSLINVVIISRALGATGRGEFAFMTTMAALTQYVATLGVQEANSVFAGKSPALRRTLATNSIILAALLGGAASGLVVLLIRIEPAIAGPSQPLWRALALGSVPILVLYVYFVRLVQAEYRFGLTNAVWLLFPIVNVAGNGMTYASGTISVGSALAFWLGGQWAATIILGAFIGTRMGGFGLPEARLATRSITFGLKTHFGVLMMISNYRLDQWILGAVKGARELGFYSVAVTWAETLYFLPQAIASVLRPDLVRGTVTKAREEASAGFRIATVTTALLAVGVITVAPVLTVIAFGEDFHQSIAELRVLTLGAFGIVGMKILGGALTAQRRPLLETAGIAIAFAVTVALDIVLIPSLGGMGAAIASVAAYSVGGVALAAIYLHAFHGRISELVPRPKELLAVVRRGRYGHPPVATDSVDADRAVGG